MSIAGFDPSGGAGVLADVKTFELHGVQGLSVITANTLQTEDAFHSVNWVDLEFVLKSVDVLVDRYPVEMIKIGIVPSFDYLLKLVSFIKEKNSTAKIIVDPVIKSSTGFNFQNVVSEKELITVLEKIFLITPNMEEILQLKKGGNEKNLAKELSKYCNVLLKGGHSENEKGVDHLYLENGTYFELKPASQIKNGKHGSGCVLSAAITANLANGYELEKACRKAKTYVEQFLESSPSLLGFHHAN